MFIRINKHQIVTNVLILKSKTHIMLFFYPEGIAFR